jgi:hypothetical protein
MLVLGDGPYGPRLACTRYRLRFDPSTRRPDDPTHSPPDDLVTVPRRGLDR